jgi:hypothetical protein
LAGPVWKCLKCNVPTAFDEPLCLAGACEGKKPANAQPIADPQQLGRWAQAWAEKRLRIRARLASPPE